MVSSPGEARVTYCSFGYGVGGGSYVPKIRKTPRVFHLLEGSQRHRAWLSLQSGDQAQQLARKMRAISRRSEESGLLVSHPSFY